MTRNWLVHSDHSHTPSHHWGNTNTHTYTHINYCSNSVTWLWNRIAFFTFKKQLQPSVNSHWEPLRVGLWNQTDIFTFCSQTRKHIALKHCFAHEIFSLHCYEFHVLVFNACISLSPLKWHSMIITFIVIISGMVAGVANTYVLFKTTRRTLMFMYDSVGPLKCQWITSCRARCTCTRAENMWYLSINMITSDATSLPGSGVHLPVCSEALQRPGSQTQYTMSLFFHHFSGVFSFLFFFVI